MTSVVHNVALLRPVSCLWLARVHRWRMLSKCSTRGRISPPVNVWAASTNGGNHGDVCSNQGRHGRRAPSPMKTIPSKARPLLHQVDLHSRRNLRTNLQLRSRVAPPLLSARIPIREVRQILLCPCHTGRFKYAGEMGGHRPLPCAGIAFNGVGRLTGQGKGYCDRFVARMRDGGAADDCGAYCGADEGKAVLVGGSETNADHPPPSISTTKSETY